MTTNGTNGSTETNGKGGRPWGLWAIGAAIPLSLGGVVLYWLRQRTRALTASPEPFEDWWQARHRARANGNGSNGTHTEAPRSRPDGSNPMFV